jgi:hypothetical protein
MSAAAGIVAVQELSLTGEWVVSCRSAKILTHLQEKLTPAVWLKPVWCIDMQTAAGSKISLRR